MNLSTTTLSSIAVCLGMLACGGSDGTDDGTGASPDDSSSTVDTATSTTNPTGAPTYYGDVEPIFRDHCVHCHQSDGIGTFSMASYDDVTDWAPAIAAAASSRTMPPWLVTSDGTCQTFDHDPSLSDDEIATIEAWAEADAPKGDVADAVSATLPEPASLDRVDLQLTTPEIVPEREGDLFAPYDEYRCFVFKDLTEADAFITGFEIDPGFDAIVHHVIGMPVDPAAPGWAGWGPNGETIDEVDGADGRPGWDCLGTAGDGIAEEGYPITWAPGMGAVHYPEGTGVRMPSDHWFVVQVHYNLVEEDNRGLPDSTGIHLRLDEQVETELFFALPDGLLESVFTGGFPDTIPPGEEAYEYEFSIEGDELWWWAAQNPNTLGVDEYKVWGVMPHMHQRGVQQSAHVTRAGGDEECLVEVPQWDFEWQLTYFYEEPVTMSFDDRLDVTCTYDTSGEDAPILPGWGTNNEMCLLVMMISK